MTQDDARKLLSGYATSSLTEAERKTLMEAALEDQGLFDEFADEAALKEVLDQPGARQRLLEALEPPRHRGWLWALVPATLAIVIGFVAFQKPTPPPQQIAQVLQSPEPVVAPAAPAPEPVPKPLPKPTRKAAPPAEVREEKLADQLQEAKPQAFGAARQLASSVPRLVFGFRYSVTADGYLEITPSISGFLSVAASDAVVFPSTRVGVSTFRIAMPPGATSLVISFSEMPGITGTPVRRDELSGTVTDQDPPNGRIFIQLFLKPATQ